MNLWTAKPSRAKRLDGLEIRPPTEREIEKLRRSAQKAADESPFRCECLSCKLERWERGRK